MEKKSVAWIYPRQPDHSPSLSLTHSGGRIGTFASQWDCSEFKTSWFAETFLRGLYVISLKFPPQSKDIHINLNCQL